MMKEEETAAACLACRRPARSLPPLNPASPPKQRRPPLKTPHQTTSRPRHPQNRRPKQTPNKTGTARSTTAPPRTCTLRSSGTSSKNGSPTSNPSSRRTSGATRSSTRGAASGRGTSGCASGTRERNTCTWVRGAAGACRLAWPPVLRPVLRLVLGADYCTVAASFSLLRMVCAAGLGGGQGLLGGRALLFI